MTTVDQPTPPTLQPRLQSPGHATLCILHLALVLLLLVPSLQAAPVPTVGVETYRRQLQQAEAALKRMEAAPPRQLNKALQPLTKTQKVRRADGEQLTVNDEEWQRRLEDVEGSATKAEIQEAREAVSARLKALDEWAGPRPASNGSAYTPASEAQTIVRQLEETGQIRTGPTRMQQMWYSVIKGMKDGFRAILRWLEGLFPRSAPVNTPSLNINPQVIWVLFGATVFAMLCVIGYFVWKAVGGRIGRRGARREVRYLEGEDLELLRLPPDELRERARRFARDGNYGEALRHLYISLLLCLDARGVWRYDTRRTNWEHIAALRTEINRAPLVRPLGELTRRFDRVRYGNARCTAEDWARFEQDVEDVENHPAAGYGSATPSSGPAQPSSSPSNPAGARL